MSNEQLYYDILKRIAHYDSPDKLRKNSRKDWDAGYTEALEMAYENMQEEARAAIKGKQRPKSLQSLKKMGTT